jgi:tetratricopeptide (TPR) repeat protein
MAIMSMINDYQNRQLIPRLLPFETSNILSLNINTSKKNYDGINAFELKNYHKLKVEWKAEKNIILAIQILFYEIIHDTLIINNELIEYLNKQKKSLNQIEKEILGIAIYKFSNNKESLQSDVGDNDVGNIIKELRISNKINPLNSLQWCNLGYCYTKLGLREKARKAFLISIGLNNSNRHIVRSAARFFLHMGDIEFGHHILSNSPRINHDPNLISAEIAFSELMKKKSKFIDRGIKLREDKDISIFEKNELLAQIATLEFSHGKNSKGRLLINECSIEPNENTLAQIAFLEKKGLIEQREEIKTSVAFQFEALARHHFNNSNFHEAYNYAKLWNNFQPFTSFPAALSTYIAIEILGRHKEAIEIAESALKISPDSISLRNNLAFSYAKINRVEEAIKVIKKVNKSEIDDYDRAVLLATTGFIAFKLGNIDDARDGYNEAINYFRLNKYEESLARALYNYSSILDKNESNAILKEVMELSKRNSIKELIFLLDRKQDDQQE